jgi:hypothetical protein
MTAPEEWDWPRQGRHHPVTIEGRVERERVVLEQRRRADMRLTWEQRFWAHPTVGRICHGVFWFGVTLWKVIFAAVQAIRHLGLHLASVSACRAVALMTE